MKILQINSARALGGGERHFADLSNALQRRGHEVYAAVRTAAPVGEKLSGLDPARVLRLPLRNALDAQSAVRLARLARERRIDIIHAHLARDYPVASLAARLAPCARLVLTRHVPFPLSRMHRLVLSNAARVIAVSGGVARGLGERRIFPAEKIEVVPNGVRIEAYDEALRGFDRETYRAGLPVRARLLVGAVGELSEVKGQEDFVRAAALIARRADVDAAFLVVGEDNSPGRALRRRLEWMIADEGLAGRVRLLGYVSELVPLLAALDLYVSPARAEAFGLATVEAMACGACVVATATDGAREIISDGETGRLVPVGDVDALAGAITRLLADEAERRRLAERGRASAQARFSLERMVEATEEVYREALAER